ncbi:MAG TPA: non-ribosomal peptide synthetase, partial [Pyrinomonadaceae bacterium]
ATPLILTQQRLLPRLPEGSARVVCLDAEWGRIAVEQGDNPESVTDADNAAFVIYTSGSTGQSKGVTLNHRGLANRILWGQQAHTLSVDDRVLQYFSYCFDFSVWEIFTALITGARLVMARPGGQQDAAYLAGLIAAQKVSVAGFVPSLLDLLLDEPGIARCASLRRIFCGGEALTVELQERCLSLLDAELQNTYGPTEASIDVTYWVCKHEDEQRKAIPIGQPIANTQIHLLDKRLQPVPVGVPGELHIGGHSLARGYLNHPALTAEKFIPNPFSREAGARLYRTGDLARYLPGGAIEFIGRLDHQLKIRGFRVEPGEIEAALGHHPCVREALVMARERAANGKQLVAYLVANGNGAALNGELQGELRRFLKERLPDYMIPSAFVQLEAWPLLPNGKVNRRALPDPAEAHMSAEAVYVAPQTELERTIAGIWQELFGLGQISIESNFFELGGHSLIMVRVHSRLREALRREIPLIDLFRYPTIGSLAKFLGGEQGDNDASSQQINKRAERQRAAANRQKQAMGWRARVNG